MTSTSETEPSRRRRLARRLGFTAPGGVQVHRAELGRWVALGALVGVAAGLSAILFLWLLHLSTRLFLGGLVGFLPPTPVGEGNEPGSPLTHPWLLPAVVAFGGLLTGLLIYFLAPEAEGHGTDEAIEAFHERAGRMRARVIPVKTLVSAITIGSGGSGGREGPTSQISAGVGSLIGQLLKLDARERRILVAAGIGAGIGAIFRAPLGGALLGAEILYTHDLETEALFPGLIASVVGYAIFGSWAGWQPIFGVRTGIAFDQPVQLLYYALLGLICGLVGILYSVTFYGVSDWYHRLRLPHWLKPVTGGLAVGLLGVVLPQVLGTSYGWLNEGMEQRVATWPIWLLLVLPFAKIVATALSIGSGGSGGTFGPGIVIGGFVGAACWRLGIGVLPGMPSSPGAVTIVGMMALFGGIAHTPFAVMVMVAEMTSNLSLVAPAMLAVGIATVVTGDHTIYRTQPATRADSPAHRYRFSFPLLSTLTVRDAMRPLALHLHPEQMLADAEGQLAGHALPGAPVMDREHRLVGILTADAIELTDPASRGSIPVRDVMAPAPATIAPDTGLDTALSELTSHGTGWLPVSSGSDQVVTGTISSAGVLTTYRSALRWSAHRLRGTIDGTILLEYRLTAASGPAGRAVRNLRLPPDTLIVSIQRAGTTILPRGSTILAPGDVLTLITRPEQESTLRDYLQRSPGGEDGTS